MAKGIKRKSSGGEREKPPSLSEQWACVRAWRTWLVSGGNPPAERSAEDLVRLRSLESAYQETLRHLDESLSAFKRREACDELKLPPLHALFVYVGLGLYPPPELLLGLTHLFDVYMSAKGAFNLDESLLLGLAKKGVGNYSKQYANHSERWKVDFIANASMDKNETIDRRTAIEQALDILGIDVDPETYERRITKEEKGTTE